MLKYQNLEIYRVPKNFRGKSKFKVQLWWFFYALLFKPSPQVLYGWRRVLLKLFGAKIGKKAIIRPTVEITYPWNLVIGDYCQIGDNVVLYTLGKIEIGNHSVISQRSYLCAGGHDYKRIEFPIFSKKIVIEDQCWIAADVYVAPGIHVGRGTVVGARSSVFKNLPSGKVCLGSPAKVIKDREHE